ncbi:Hypothetical protein NTJ_14283 [Nesidiocoris tenuis]|uniref:Uncharacterized protein n=1 Tax=Nesidiocoris tenuis TaxID=355587 RepID=A0ABN7BAU4_9HEMI|nr:Hypothetical protein NTJ_14283 [Nesidiocoris tenuis]
MEQGTVGSLNQGSRKRKSLHEERRKEERDKKYADVDPHCLLLKQKGMPCKHDSRPYQTSSGTYRFWTKTPTKMARLKMRT